MAKPYRPPLDLVPEDGDTWQRLKGPSLKKILIDIAVIVAIMASLYLGAEVLVVRGQKEGTASMTNLCQTLRGHSIDALAHTKEVSREVATKLIKTFPNFGKIETANFSIVTCQMSGTPCIFHLSLTSAKSTAGANLYVHGIHIDEVDSIAVSKIIQPKCLAAIEHKP